MMSFGLLSGFAAPAMAQELSPEHVAMARKYVDLTDRGNLYATALVETSIQTMRQVLSTNPTLAQQANEAITATLGVYKDRRGDLLNQFARVYAINFSLEELTQIVAFYETPVGQKLTLANPVINESLTAVVTVFRNNLSSEFFAAVRAELKKAGYDV